MKKILISACLAGDIVRYDGKQAPLDHPIVRNWAALGLLVKCCPEVAGGLPVPRPPAEITGGTAKAVGAGSARVVTASGRDVSAAFLKGARAALDLVKAWDIGLAILKEKSPSCGSTLVYDGSFSRRLIPGTGVTTSVLRDFGVAVFSENEIHEAYLFVKRNIHY